MIVQIPQVTQISHVTFTWVVASSLLSCGAFNTAIEGSGVIVDETHTPEPFDSLAGESGLDLEITQADGTHEVLVRIDDNLQKYVDVDRDGTHVTIGLSGFPNGRHPQPTEWSAEVKMESLSAINLSGGSWADFSGFELDDVDINASGGSELTAAPGQSITGTVDANGSGGSLFQLQHLPISTLTVNLSGGSQCTVQIQDGGKITADLSGGSRLDYCGTDVHLTSNTSGGSQVNHLDNCS